MNEYNPSEELKLVMFCHIPAMGAAALEAGVKSVIVDCEVTSKSQRQHGYDTQISTSSPTEVRDILKVSPSLQVACRIDRASPKIQATQIELAISLGAREIYLPMVKSPEDVADALTVIRGRSLLTVMIETEQAIENISGIAALPIDGAYVGLNDLRIERGTSNIFLPLVDGTVDHIRQEIPLPLGVGGVTDPEKGYPISSRLLIAEYARAGIDFSFLRRSFMKDRFTRSMTEIVRAIRREDQLFRKSIDRQSALNLRDELVDAVEGWKQSEPYAGENQLSNLEKARIR